MQAQNIHYLVEGKGAPVVLLHGFLENMSMWDEFSTELKKQYLVIRIDLLGHGKTISCGAIYSMEKQAEIVKSVLDKEHISQAVIVGHSMGGYITLAFVEQYPEKVKGYSLFFSSAADDSPEKKEQRNRAAELVKKQRKAFIHKAIPNLFHKPEKDTLQPFVQKSKEMAEKMTAENIAASLYGMRLRKDRTHLLKTSIPKQLLTGNFDVALDQNILQEQVNSAHNLDHKIFDVGHMGHYEAPKETLNEVKSFLEKCYSKHL